MNLLPQLKKLADRHAELARLLAQPEATNDMDAFTRMNREYAELTPVIEAYAAYETMLKNRSEAQAILKDPTAEADMKDLAQLEIDELYEKIPAADEHLKIQLLPKDEADSRNIILEVRAGTGGEEAALFAADVFRMYSLYAQSQGWRVEIDSESAADMGGLKEVIARISGQNVYQKLKYESGVHRVQRVPATETQGRIHTSAITVAVLPEAEEVDVKVEAKDLRIDVFRSSGPGGQSVNTTDLAVRITHIPTGIVAQCQDEKSQHKNRDKAMKILLARVLDAERQKADSERADARKSMVGSGDRSERIRTYNYPQSRVTDHRINLTLHSLNDIMAGHGLEDVITPLIQEDQAKRLAALAEREGAAA